MRKFLWLSLAALVLAGMPRFLGAGEAPPKNGEEIPAIPGEDKKDLALLKQYTLDSALVVEGRATGVRQCFRRGKFTGNLQVLVSVNRVLKGVLGPVMTVQVPLPLADKPRFEALLKGVTFPDAPLFVLFLDEIDRFRLPPLFRFSASPRLSSRVAEVEGIVKAETERWIEELHSEKNATRDTAFKALVALGSPAIGALTNLQKGGAALVADEARLAVNTIRHIAVDPFRIFQPNRKYPDEPVPAFASPQCLDILFRLAPGTLVFRLIVWEDGNRTSYRIRTHDGREGWIQAKACVRQPCEGW